MDAQSTEARTQSWIDAIASELRAFDGKSGKWFFYPFFHLGRFVASGDAIACGIASASCMRWLRMLEDPRHVCAGCAEKEQDRRDC